MLLVILCLGAGIFVGMAVGSFLRRARSLLSIMFAITIISLISILGFSGGSGILASGDRVLLYIPIALIAALTSGLMSVISSLAIEKGLRIRLVLNSNPGFGSRIVSSSLPRYVLIAFASSILLGVLVGRAVDIDTLFPASQILLLVLMLIVGIDLGIDPGMLRESLVISLRCWHVWLGAIVGSTISGFFLMLLFDMKISLASSLAMGWYTYVAGYLYTLYGAEYSIYAFLQNYFREALTYIAIPLLSKTIRSPSLVAFGGVTTMDNTLPAIVAYLGREYIFVAISSGIILTLLVPFIVPLAGGLPVR